MSEQPVTPALQRRLTGTLFISESLFSASVIASFTLMPIVAQELTGRDSLAGIPSTMMLIGQAAAAYPLGRLMDRFGRRTGLSIGYFIAAAGAVL
ncbi:MAG: MFS transporter, partial [Caldilineaceae bacterium]|nr:MFS transporter [Caldilineaceae bacterium]